jgi:putative endonuclease
MSNLPYCVYILQSERDEKLYTGFTTDLRQRLTAHFHGHVESTALRRPLRLIYCEYHSAKADALRREAYLKTSAGKKAIKLMLREALASSSRTPP